MASGSEGSSKQESSSLGSDLKRRAAFTVVLVAQLILDGIAALFILLILNLLERAITFMGIPDGNILRMILQYSHLAILILFLFFAIISVYSLLRERVKGESGKKSKRKAKSKPKPKVK